MTWGKRVTSNPLPIALINNTQCPQRVTKKLAKSQIWLLNIARQALHHVDGSKKKHTNTFHYNWGTLCRTKCSRNKNSCTLSLYLPCIQTWVNIETATLLSLFWRLFPCSHALCVLSLSFLFYSTQNSAENSLISVITVYSPTLFYCKYRGMWVFMLF